MKNMYAVKCLYKYSFYTQNKVLIEDIMPGWEERIILIKAENINDADNKSEVFAKEYVKEYVNVDNQIVRVELYEILDIFDIFDIFDIHKNSNLEIYSKMFSANQKDVENILEIMYSVNER